MNKLDHQEALRMRFSFAEDVNEVDVELGSLSLHTAYFPDCKVTVAKELRAIKRALDSHEALIEACRLFDRFISGECSEIAAQTAVRAALNHAKEGA